MASKNTYAERLTNWNPIRYFDLPGKHGSFQFVDGIPGKRKARSDENVEENAQRPDIRFLAVVDVTWNF